MVSIVHNTPRLMDKLLTKLGVLLSIMSNQLLVSQPSYQSIVDKRIGLSTIDS